jgi:sulfate transport system permease protein
LFSCFAPAFIGLSFAVRTVRPVLEALENDVEEAACPVTDRLQTFAGLMFPALFTSQLTTFTLAFVRWVGECGSITFIAGNMPLISEITPLLIITRLEQPGQPPSLR